MKWPATAWRLVNFGAGYEGIIEKVCERNYFRGENRLCDPTGLVGFECYCYSSVIFVHQQYYAPNLRGEVIVVNEGSLRMSNNPNATAVELWERKIRNIVVRISYDVIQSLHAPRGVLRDPMFGILCSCDISNSISGRLLASQAMRMRIERKSLKPQFVSRNSSLLR